MTTLAQRIAALPEWPHETARRKAQFDLARDFIRERLVDGCYHCTGNGIVWDDTLDEQPCPACADARFVLEAIKDKRTEVGR